MNSTEFAVGLTRVWTRLYTFRLPAACQDRRREELESDIWEHLAADGLADSDSRITASQMFGRLVTGVPADIAWRFEQRNQVKRSSGMFARIQQLRWQEFVNWALVFILTGFLLASGVGIAVGMEDSSVLVKVSYGSGVFASGLLLLIGFALSSRQPLAGAALLVIGTISGAVLMWWFLFIPPVVGLIVVIFGLKRARNFSRMGVPAGGLNKIESR